MMFQQLKMEWMTWKEIELLAVNELGGFIMCMISSFIFVYLLLKILSPRIEISPYISKQNIDGTDSYVFKIVNRSIFHAYNVRFHLVKREPHIVDGNKINHRMIEIPLVKSELFSIPRFRKGKDVGEFAALIRTTVNISVDMGDNNLDYELSVSVSHGLSNITKVVRQRYNNQNLIYNKGFKFGKSLKIIT